MTNRMPGNSGLSRIELICIIILILVALGFAVIGFMYYQHAMSKGDDGMKARTCERVATVNLLETGCVVNGCDRQKGTTCIHQVGDVTVGYWDAVAKKVFADKPAGYNEYPKMKIGKTVYHGKVHTMVIKVEGRKDKIKLTWVKGDNS